MEDFNTIITTTPERVTISIWCLLVVLANQESWTSILLLRIQVLFLMRESVAEFVTDSAQILIKSPPLLEEAYSQFIEVTSGNFLAEYCADITIFPSCEISQAHDIAQRP